MADSIGRLNELYDKAFTSTFVYPDGAPVTLTSGAGAYAFGAYSADLVAANEITKPFVINHVAFGDPDTNGDYAIEFYYGASDTVVVTAAFYRGSPFVSSIDRIMTSIIMPQNSRVRARLKHSAGGGATCIAKIYCQTIGG